VRGRGAWLALLTIAIALAVLFGTRSSSRERQLTVPNNASTPARSTSASAPNAPSSSATAARAVETGSSLGAGGGKGFRSAQRLDEHFAKHGAEFGRISEQEYLRQAQRLRDAPAGDDIEELRRSDGTVSRFDKRSGAFIAFDADGTIRTFFKPNDGEAYFRRQASRAH
jgi:hypothetical protein